MVRQLIYGFLVTIPGIGILSLSDINLVDENTREANLISENFDNTFDADEHYYSGEYGIWDGEKEAIEKDCKNMNNSEECSKILDWSFNNGKCKIYVRNSNTEQNRYEWYLGQLKPNLLKEILKKEDTYKDICRRAKSISFLYEEGKKEWRNDGYKWIVKR